MTGVCRRIVTTNKFGLKASPGVFAFRPNVSTPVFFYSPALIPLLGVPKPIPIRRVDECAHLVGR